MKLSTKSYSEITINIQSIIQKEIQLRELIEEFLNLNSIQYSYESFINRLPFECSICEELNYMSYVECRSCLRKSCISHLSICKCEEKTVVLYYRFNNDLKYYLKNKSIIDK